MANKTKNRLREKYSQVDNRIANNYNLSFQAIGFYTFINSKPDGWEFTYKGIMAQRRNPNIPNSKPKEGEKALMALVKELTLAGALVRVRATFHNDTVGGYGGFDWIINPDAEDIEQARFEDPILVRLKEEIEIKGVKVGGVKELKKNTFNKIAPTIEEQPQPKKKKAKQNQSNSISTSKEKQNIAQILYDAWNEKSKTSWIGGLRTLNKTRISKVETRIKNNPNFKEEFLETLELVDTFGEFYRKSWFSFDWLIANENNLTKMLEGKYTDSQCSNNAQGFQNSNDRYFETKERELLEEYERRFREQNEIIDVNILGGHSGRFEA
jgi:hypothetical protein